MRSDQAVGNSYITVSAKGQVTIPANLRKQMKLRRGTKIFVQREGNTLVMCPITRGLIDSLMGCTTGAGAERQRAHRQDF